VTNLTDAELIALSIEHYPDPDDPDGCWSCCEAWVCPTAEALAELRELRGKLELTTGRPVAYFSSTSRPGFITPEKTPNNGPTLSLTGESRSQPTTTTSGGAIDRGNSGRASRVDERYYLPLMTGEMTADKRVGATGGAVCDATYKLGGL